MLFFSMQNISRRKFIQTTSLATAALLTSNTDGLAGTAKKVTVGAHLWVYASKYPPNWDCTPIIEQVFSDLKYAGMDGVEVMHTNLFHADAVTRLSSLTDKYKLPVIGTSYSADMWNKEKHSQIEDECGMLTEKLLKLNAKTIGLTVGNAGHRKTGEELDLQAAILRKILAQSTANGITPNLHNHTYEVTDGMHDLQGTLERIPDFPLGPDLNWLIRGGVDPVEFIKKHKKQIVYLHIRDQFNNGEWSEAVGEGETDFTSISTALHAIEFDGIATIELAFPNNFTPTRELRDSWKQSRNHVKKVFGY